MKRIVVDANIIFSALLNDRSSIGDVLFQSAGVYEFFTPDYALEELTRHREKLVRLRKRQEPELEAVTSLVLARITVVPQADLPQHALMAALRLTMDIDPADTLFVALAIHLDAMLWTGDKKLLSGLLIKGFEQVTDTASLL